MKASSLVKRGDDDVADGHERHHRGHDEERDLPQPALEALAHGGRNFFGRAEHAGHLRQLRRGHRHPEQADRQHIDDLGVRQRRDRGRAEQRGQEVVHVAGKLHDAFAHHDRREVADDFVLKQIGPDVIGRKRLDRPIDEGVQERRMARKRRSLDPVE